MMSVSACETASFEAEETVSTCSIPPWPAAGAAAADELDKVCPTKDADGTPINPCPALNDWHARLNVYKQQVEANP